MLNTDDGTVVTFIADTTGSVLTYGTFTNHPVAFKTNNGERARIDSSGRLLVGTSTARATFGSSAAPQIQSEGTTTATGSIAVIKNNASDGGYIFLANTGGSTVGSTTATASSSELGAVSFNGFDGSNFKEGATIRAVNDQASAWASGDCPARLVFSTTADGASSPTERMRISNGGAFKATTTGSYSLPSSKIHELRSDLNDRSLWVSNTHNTSPAGIYVKYEGADPNNTGNEFLVCDGNTTIRATIRSNGGIANFSANNVNLSDRNVKKDITPAAGTWDCLKEWEIVNFRYKDQPDDADLNMGVIAQQVAESCPEVITVFQEATEDQPEKLGVKDQQMMWMAIKALQEAQLRIETLEAEVAALKGA
jgi:hypothetical protein